MRASYAGATRADIRKVAIPDWRAAAKQLQRKGLTFTEIAAELGISRDTIVLYLYGRG